MARMIPAFCPEEAPPGEKKLYGLLREDPVTKDWVVLHSLGIARHERQVEGEADFVVIVPGKGLLVIEVKSHRNLSVGADGLWRLGGDPPTIRSPFQQALEAKHSIKKFLDSSNLQLSNVPFNHAVWFTEIRARASIPKSSEWHEWQLLEAPDLRNPGNSIERVLKDGIAHLRDKMAHFGRTGIGPDSHATERIAELLRPTFEVASTPGDRRQIRNGELAKFVSEQFRALDMVADNDAVLIMGQAGTGKTFLAIEAARREIAQGRTGRLICFNRLLAAELKREVGGLAGLHVSTFHSEMLRLAGFTNVPENFSGQFWDSELPELALEGLASSGEDEVLDFLIVDEFQDIASPKYLDLLDLMVRGGFKHGRYIFFADFERQAIYSNQDLLTGFKERFPTFSTFRLIENCRNLPRIGFQVNLLGHLTPGYRNFRRQDDGVDPSVRKYVRPDEQDEMLREAVFGLRDDGYDLSEIVVLSPLSSESVAETTRDPYLKQILLKVETSNAQRGRLRYSTIHAFKGLDAPAIILTDICDTGLQNLDSLLYVGMTRATDRLTVLVESKTLHRLLGGN